jgi:hypothetical protein
MVNLSFPTLLRPVNRAPRFPDRVQKYLVFVFFLFYLR